MLQLTNKTPFSLGLDIFPNERGVDTLYITLKATFRLGASLSVAEEQLPILASDVHWGEPTSSSIKYPGERHLTKPSTDVLLIGQAHSPKGKAVTELDVWFSVAKLSKVVRVIGDRIWKGGRVLSRITSPEPFIRMPLIYERAFGGTHEPEQGESTFEPRNPIGRGFRGKRNGGELDGMPLPNLEDPAKPLEQVGDRSNPACFAPIAAAWVPRKNHAGTYDERWRKHRAPYLPEDFNPRFFHVAPQELIAPTYLRGGEPVKVINASPNGPLQFSLPVCHFLLEAQIAGKVEKPQPNLETVIVEPDEKRLSMLWRAAVSCDKKAIQVQEVVLNLGRLELAA